MTTTDLSIAPVELDGVIGEVAHVACHMGGIRQIQPAARRPKHTSS